MPKTGMISVIWLKLCGFSFYFASFYSINTSFYPLQGWKTFRKDDILYSIASWSAYFGFLEVQPGQPVSAAAGFFFVFFKKKSFRQKGMVLVCLKNRCFEQYCYGCRPRWWPALYGFFHLKVFCPSPKVFLVGINYSILRLLRRWLLRWAFGHPRLFGNAVLSCLCCWQRLSVQPTERLTSFISILSPAVTVIFGTGLPIRWAHFSERRRCCCWIYGENNWKV